jgi:hypothetical protein
MGKAIVIHNHRNFAFRDGNPSATADGTDCFLSAIWTFNAKPLGWRGLVPWRPVIVKYHGEAVASRVKRNDK